MEKKHYPPLTGYEITCANGYVWQTSMAAHVTLEMAEAYFLGKEFNTQAYSDECECVLSKAIKVIRLE